MVSVEGVLQGKIQFFSVPELGVTPFFPSKSWVFSSRGGPLPWHRKDRENLDLFAERKVWSNAHKNKCKHDFFVESLNRLYPQKGIAGALPMVSTWCSSKLGNQN